MFFPSLNLERWELRYITVPFKNSVPRDLRQIKLEDNSNPSTNSLIVIAAAVQGVAAVVAGDDDGLAGDGDGPSNNITITINTKVRI